MMRKTLQPIAFGEGQKPPPETGPLFVRPKRAARPLNWGTLRPAPLKRMWEVDFVGPTGTADKREKCPSRAEGGGGGGGGCFALSTYRFGGSIWFTNRERFSELTRCGCYPPPRYALSLSLFRAIHSPPITGPLICSGSTKRELFTPPNSEQRRKYGADQLAVCGCGREPGQMVVSNHSNE